MITMNRNIIEAEELLVSKPLMATSVERFMIMNEIKSQYRELPQPKRFARFLSILLDRVSVPIEDYDLLAGRCVDRELSPEEEVAFQEFIHHPDGKLTDVFISSGHCTYSWDFVVQEGLPGMRATAQQSLEQQTDDEKKIFLSALIDIYDIIRDYLLRYASAAEQKGMKQLSEICMKAATQRPDSFFVALQLLWIITFIDCSYITKNPTLTVGRLDQILYPLYERDIKIGRMTREEAAEYIIDYYCKHNLIMGRGEHQVGDASNSTTFDRICCFDAPQYLLLAGTDENGKSAVNDLTKLFAECICPKFKNPVIVVRYFKNMNEQHPELWKILTQKALQSASMMFYNDDNVTSTFRRIGLPEKDARNHAHFGCNWPSPGDNGAWLQQSPRASKFQAFLSEAEEQAHGNLNFRTRSPHGWPEDVVILLNEFAMQESADISIEDFYRAFFDRMEEYLDYKLAFLAKEVEVKKRRPAALATFGDCFLKNSVKKGECFAAGADCFFAIQSFYMFGTVVDCFITIDKLVFQDKKITLRHLAEAVEHNFEGYEDVLALCRNVPKYGSDTPHSNAHTKRIAETYCDLVIRKNRPYFEKMKLFLEPCMQSDTWHLKFGETFGATPDGRLAYTSFSQNSRPSNGACINGLTAMLNSMLNLPSDGLLSGALNLDVDPKQFQGESGHALFAALLAVYFNKGGLHAQVSSVGLEDLLDAQKHPELHRDLRVRVTGYSGVFVDICKRLQDDIIERFQ